MEKNIPNIMKKIICELLELTYKNIVTETYDFMKIERDKNEVIRTLESKLDSDDRYLLYKIQELFERQLYITIIGFEFVKALDKPELKKIIEEAWNEYEFRT